MQLRKVLSDTEVQQIFAKFSAENPGAHPTQFARAVEVAVQSKLIDAAIKKHTYGVYCAPQLIADPHGLNSKED